MKVLSYRSPDGYALFACSLDGTVATFYFEAKELGHRLSDSELDDLKRNRYGDVRGRQANLAESPAQLLLEAVAAKQSAPKRVVVPPSSGQPLKVNATEKSTDSQTNPSEQSVPKPPEKLVDEVKDGGDDPGLAAPARTSSPVKQREYRRPDGRKRIIPEAVGMPTHQDNVTSSGQAQAVDFSSLGQGQSNDENMAKRPFCGRTEAKLHVKERQATTAQATIHESLVIEKASGLAPSNGEVIPHSGTAGFRACGVISIRVCDKKDGNSDSKPVFLEAKPVEKAAQESSGIGSTFSRKETEICCKKGNKTLWLDRISANVTVLAGNVNFWAAGCEDGCLQVLKIKGNDLFALIIY